MKKVAFLGNYTIDLLAKEYQKKHKSDCKVYISGYNQYMFDIINDDSDYNHFSPDFTVLLLEGNTLLNGRNIEQIKKEISNIITNFKQKQKGYLLLGNIFIDPEHDRILNYNHHLNAKQQQLEINAFLNEIAANDRSIFIIDILSIIEHHGYLNLFDKSLWLNAKVLFNKAGHLYIIEKLDHLLNAIMNNTKKCLVLDLDNTLWGGIIGEDGIHHIKLGNDNIGNIYKDFQKNIKQLKEKGILLAICSKNNEADAKEVFDKHQDTVLTWEDFIIKKVNWQPKNYNVKSIAKELNIGEDSLVFIDDNPFERELVKESTVAEVPDFPENIEFLPTFFATIEEKYFPKLSITEEDKEKTKQYYDNIKRDQLKNEVNSIDDYIATLEMQLLVEPFKQKNLARIAQMTQKTNQFNFTTKRYTESEVQKLIDSGNHLIYTGQVKDKFGDYGIVILIIFELHKKTANIDTFLMSCRVIGRKVENAFISAIANKLKAKGIDKILAEYIPTQKNVLIKDKLDEMEFQTISVTSEGHKKYSIKLNNIKTNNELIDIEYGR